jgi:hypothetical protein
MAANSLHTVALAFALLGGWWGTTVGGQYPEQNGERLCVHVPCLVARAQVVSCAIQTLRLVSCDCGLKLDFLSTSWRVLPQAEGSGSAVSGAGAYTSSDTEYFECDGTVPAEVGFGFPKGGAATIAGIDNTYYEPVTNGEAAPGYSSPVDDDSTYGFPGD